MVIRRLVCVADGRVAQRLLLALDMYEFGEEMQRSRLRRLRPDATAAEIDAELRVWRKSRPGAPAALEALERI